MASYNDVYKLHSEIQLEDQTEAQTEEQTEEQSDDCCDVECCENECICPANACATIVYLSTSVSLSVWVTLSDSSFPLTVQSTRYINKPLYRPPIFPS